MPRKLIVYIAASVDGFIAKPNDDLSFLSIVQKQGEDYGYENFISGVDTIIMGRKTYDWITKQVDFPHADKTSYIITRNKKPNIGNINFYTGELSTLVNDLKSKPGKTIFCDGGAEIVNQLLNLRLVDELIISVIPIIVGNGTRLFNNTTEQKLELLSAKSFDTGLVQLHYKCINNQ
ncbi:MAG: dihydrofolate reductase [Bacteroidia bacterium]|nr:dihydrofolate reductase [Bacteroidia bacterium]